MEKDWTGLVELLFKQQQIITGRSTLGVLLSNDESIDCFCGSVLSLGALEVMCEQALKVDSLRVWLLLSNHVSLVWNNMLTGLLAALSTDSARMELIRT